MPSMHLHTCILEKFLKNFSIQRLLPTDSCIPIRIFSIELSGSVLCKRLVPLGVTYKRCSVAGWPTSTGPNGEVLVIPKDRLESLSRDPVWVPGQNIWPLIGLNPGL